MNKVERVFTGLEKLEPGKTDLNTRSGNSLGMNWYDLSINYNSIPYKSDMAIVVTTYYNHFKFLKPVLIQYRKTGKFIVCAYDQYFKGWDNLSQEMTQRYLPRPDHFVLAHTWVFKHPTYDCDKRNGWFWDVRYAQGIIRQFPNLKYVFCVNGDCLWEKPENVDRIAELLGEGNLISGQSNGIIPHTASVLYKIDAFNQIFDYMSEQMRVPVIGSRSPEGMLSDAVKFLKLKEVVAPQQPIYPDGSIDYYTCYAEPSTWRDILGYRNLFAEMETAVEERREPPLPKEYLDPFQNWLYFDGYERETICKYYDTGDRRYIMMWHDQGEDDYRFRKYLPLETYGDKPIWEKKENLQTV